MELEGDSPGGFSPPEHVVSSVSLGRVKIGSSAAPSIGNMVSDARKRERYPVLPMKRVARPISGGPSGRRSSGSPQASLVRASATIQADPTSGGFRSRFNRGSDAPGDILTGSPRGMGRSTRVSGSLAQIPSAKRPPAIAKSLACTTLSHGTCPSRSAGAVGARGRPDRRFHPPGRSECVAPGRRPGCHRSVS